MIHFELEAERQIPVFLVLLKATSEPLGVLGREPLSLKGVFTAGGN